MATELNNPTVRCLEEYSQLSSVTDRSKIYFVRNAAGSQHGDPTVKKGWAIYFYDTDIGGWRKFGEEESLLDGKGGGGSIDPSILEQYVKRTEIAGYIEQCAQAEAKAEAAEQAATQARVEAQQAALEAQEAKERANQVEAQLSAVQETANEAKRLIDALITNIRLISRAPRETVTAYELHDMLLKVLQAADK